MTILLRTVAGFLAFALITLSTACTSMRRIDRIDAPASPAPFRRIEVGDPVIVVMKDGRRDRFEVKAIPGDTLVSTTEAQYARSEMAELICERIDPRKALTVLGVSVYGAGARIYILSRIHFGGI